jgi:hypothetical protein
MRRIHTIPSQARNGRSTRRLNRLTSHQLLMRQHERKCASCHRVSNIQAANVAYSPCLPVLADQVGGESHQGAGCHPTKGPLRLFSPSNPRKRRGPRIRTAPPWCPRLRRASGIPLDLSRSHSLTQALSTIPGRFCQRGVEDRGRRRVFPAFDPCLTPVRRPPESSTTTGLSAATAPNSTCDMAQSKGKPAE